MDKLKKAIERQKNAYAEMIKRPDNEAAMHEYGHATAELERMLRKLEKLLGDNYEKFIT